MRHSQDLGKRARLERAAASSIKKERRRSQLRRLRELQERDARIAENSKHKLGSTPSVEHIHVK